MEPSSSIVIVLGNVSKSFLLNEQLLIEFWKPHEKFVENSVFFENRDRSFPDELGDEEEWIREMMEPLHRDYFDAGKKFNSPKIQKPHEREFTYSLPEEEYTEDDRIAVLTMHRPKEGSKHWKEIVLLRHWKTVHIYGMIEVGRKFYRRLEYTTDARFS